MTFLRLWFQHVPYGVRGSGGDGLRSGSASVALVRACSSQIVRHVKQRHHQG